MVIGGPMGEMMKLIIHWQYRADQARGVADEMTDPTCRALMLTVAEDYERMAQEFRERMDGGDETTSIQKVGVG